MKRLFLTLAGILLAGNVFAQTTVPQVEWDHLSVSLSTINTYQFSFKYNATTAVTALPSCSTAGANVHCILTTPTITYKSGDIVIITAILNGQTASGTTTYNPGPGPNQPSNVTIIIKINIP